MHTCINPKPLEAAVNMIDLQRGKRRLPARAVLHGGSQSHTADRLRTLHGDSITSCSLDAAHENPLLCINLGHPAGFGGNFGRKHCATLSGDVVASTAQGSSDTCLWHLLTAPVCKWL